MIVLTFYNFLLFTIYNNVCFKDEQIHRTSKSVDIKSVDVKHPKTASYLLNPIEQSNKITQELETVEKPIIFDIESVIIEHPKTATDLSKSIKNLKTITQQQ